MYYMLNHIFIVFITIAISFAYTKEASSALVLVFLLKKQSRNPNPFRGWDECDK